MSFRRVTESNKVITTMVIGPLDDHTYCVRSTFTHLGLCRKLYDCSLHHFTACKYVLKCTLLTFSSTSNWRHQQTQEQDIHCSRYQQRPHSGDDTRQQHEVCFIMNKTRIKSIISCTPVSNRIITIRISAKREKNSLIMQLYALMSTYDDDLVEEFYEQL